MTAMPRAWLIQVTRSVGRGKWTSTAQVPSFVLPKFLGLCTQEDAVKVALEILGQQSGVEHHVAVAEFDSAGSVEEFFR